tara:strand:+ start:502 stop:933 length:432 start_codon:yes stop_codon:yes gene_type:complete
VLNTVDITPVDTHSLSDVVRDAMGDDEDIGYLVVGMNEQILGGGVRRGSLIVDCWKVSDFKAAAHWIEMIHPRSRAVQLSKVPIEMIRILRSTLDRFSADGHRRIAAELNKCRGYDSSISAIVSTILEDRDEQGGSRGAGSIS